MDPSKTCDLKGEDAFIKILERELNGTKISSLTRSRSLKGGKKSRKNLKMTGGITKLQVKFAVKAFIYLIFALLSFGGCVEIYTNVEFLTKVAKMLGITVEAFILIISAVVTGVKTDYRNDSLIKIPFDYIRGVVAGHHIVGKQIIDVVIFFVRSKNQLNTYLEEKIEEALNDNHANAITNDTVVDQSLAVSAVTIGITNISSGITNIMSFVRDFRLQSEDVSNSNALVLHKKNSVLATPRSPTGSRQSDRQKQILNAKLNEEKQKLDEELNYYMRTKGKSLRKSLRYI
jgi:hypothetical protein